jgi:abortive infection bacteriophage resistance protein
MVAYTKPWLSIDEQIAKLAGRGVDVGSRERATRILESVGYYRLTGYLHPFRIPVPGSDATGHRRILGNYRPGTSIEHAVQLIDFDRRLRLLVLDGVERTEIAVRMQVGYVLGRRGPFSHTDPANFTRAFTEVQADPRESAKTRSDHAEWLQRVDARRAGSDEAFVAHYRDKYDDQMPIWALTELLELGHLARLYRGLDRPPADEIALAFCVPTKKLMTSWLASLNYVRNVAAHHARLFNRKLQDAPGRPKRRLVPLLDHLRDEDTPKSVHGLYNALAVIAFMLRSIDPDADWDRRLGDLVATFPTSTGMTVASMGFPENWIVLDLWSGAVQAQRAASE